MAKTALKQVLGVSADKTCFVQNNAPIPVPNGTILNRKELVGIDEGGCTQWLHTYCEVRDPHTGKLLKFVYDSIGGFTSFQNLRDDEVFTVIKVPV
jgi:hypothetical protein